MSRTPAVGTVFNLKTTTAQKCAAVPRRARIQGSSTLVSRNFRLESNEEEEEAVGTETVLATWFLHYYL